MVNTIAINSIHKTLQIYRILLINRIANRIAINATTVTTTTTDTVMAIVAPAPKSFSTIIILNLTTINKNLKI